MEILYREFIYIWYYFEIQLRQILPYWALGMVIGSVISVFGKQKIHSLMTAIQDRHLSILGIIPASLIGIVCNAVLAFVRVCGKFDCMITVTACRIGK